MSSLNPRLVAIGDDLHRAIEAILRARAAGNPRRGRRLVAMFAGALIVPAAAVAGDRLISPAEVARGMPAGTLSLAGTEPTCTVERENVQFHCVLEHAPAPEVTDWKGTVEATAGADKRVNGGCRSLSSDGREWRCYVGQAAVEEQIIGQGLLGEPMPMPASG